MKRQATEETSHSCSSSSPTTNDSEQQQHVENSEAKKPKLETLYDTHHLSIPHNPHYCHFWEHDLFRVMSKYFPQLKELKDKTPVPTPKSEQDHEMIRKAQKEGVGLSEKEKHKEKQYYTVQRRMAYFLIDEIFKQSPIRCCPYCWLNIDYCICKQMVFPWRENKHLDTFVSEPSEELNSVREHCEKPSELQSDEPRLKIILLMHAKEFFRKSNTGKILMDTLPKGFVEIYLVDVEAHEIEFKEKYYGQELTYLLFPSEDALDLDQTLVEQIKQKQMDLSKEIWKDQENYSTTNKRPMKSINLIIVDSTWQQAKHVLKALCNKKDLPNRLKFDQSKVVHLYQQKEPIFNLLRKQTEKDRTSTLECALLCMFLFDLYSSEFSKPLLYNLKLLVVTMHKMCHKALNFND